jgi:protein gp37
LVGGESGPGARPCRVEWIESIVAQCAAAGLACWVKQLGAYAILDPRYDCSISGSTRRLRDRKGADMDEWPESLRVREFPK